ncbi:MAG: hypothetical protein M3Q97_10390 [Bacteroidota bacterium]|nr:hypothetical protein [Bacteroidota bacterium]
MPSIGFTSLYHLNDKVNLGINYSWQKTKILTKIKSTGNLNTPFPLVGLKLNYRQAGIIAEFKLGQKNKVGLYTRLSFDIILTDISRFLSPNHQTNTEGKVYSRGMPEKKAEYVTIVNHISSSSFVIGSGLKLAYKLTSNAFFTVDMPVYLGLKPIVTTATHFTVDDGEDYGAMSSSFKADGTAVMLGFSYLFNSRQKKE